MTEQKLDQRILKKNMAFAFLAQGVALVLSLLMALVLPKILNVTEYGYWQLFLFYASYAGLFHFGLNDGVYLRFGGHRYESLDHALLGTELKIWTLFQALLAAVISLIGIFCLQDSNRIFVLIAAAILMVLFNSSYFLGYIFQAVNRTRIFSLADMINKSAFILCLLALILWGVDRFQVFICFYLLCIMGSVVFYLYWGRHILFSTFLGWRQGLKEIFKNVAVGINLLLANLAGILILGIGRIIIDSLWGIESFGKVSFSLTLTNFFLVFIAQVSMVLFPALRQIDIAAQKRYYGEINAILSISLPLILVFYIPIKTALLQWLPQYAVSLDYLAILLPLCLFDGKMQLLCTTYFKVLRKEKALLYVNLAACFLSLLLSVIGGYLLKSVDAIVFAMLIGVVGRYVLSAGYLSRYLPGQSWTVLGTELVFAAAFIAVSLKLPALWSFLSVSVLYLCYLFCNRSQARMVRQRLLRR